LAIRLPTIARADRTTAPFRWTGANLGALAFFAISYWLSVKASEHLYGSLRLPSPFWLPDSVLLCALLLWRREAWWALAVVALPVRLLAGAQDGTPQWFIVTSMLNDVSKAYFSAWLLQRLIRRPIQLDTLREFLIFVSVAAGLSPLLSALAGAATRSALGNPVLEATSRWYLGDALAQVVVTPAILYWFRGNYRHAGARSRELAIVCVGMVLLTSYVFLIYEGPLAPLLLYAPVPLLAWAALRLRPFGTANAIAIVASIAVLSVVKGIGVFPGSSPDRSVESIQLFLLVLSVSFLSIAVLAAEQQKRVEEFRTLLDALRESEERFRLLADTAPVLIWTSGTDKLCTFANQAWLDFTGRSMAQELGTGWSFSIHPDDVDRVMATYEEAFDRRMPCEMEYRLRRHDGTYRWIADYGVPRFESSGAFCGYIGSCLDVTDRKSVEATLRELSGRLISAQEHERVRIARELHDDLGQQVALLQMSIDRFEAGLSNLSDDSVQQLRAISRGTERMASGIHKTAHQLHPFKLEVVGLVTALNGLCREFSEQHELSVQFVQHDMPPLLSQDASLCLFRIAQEALHNVVKHARVSKATVELSGRNGEVELCIADSGAGFDVDSAAAKGGLGLVSMRERLRLVGGRLSIEALQRQGTRISACVPAGVRHGADFGPRASA
jgi:PAS domain S-box-containing protein